MDTDETTELGQLLGTEDRGQHPAVVRQLKRRVRAGIDWHLDKADEQAEHDATERANIQRQAEDAELRPIRERRHARRQIDYGAD